VSLGVKEVRSVRLAVANLLNNSQGRMHADVLALIEKCSWFGVLSVLFLDENVRFRVD
jgi:hypothetical protein